MASPAMLTDHSITTSSTFQAPPGDYSESGVPTFDYVRDRIENRAATSIGSQELAGETPEGKAVADQFEARERAGRDKLEEIRRQMRGE